MVRGTSKQHEDGILNYILTLESPTQTDLVNKWNEDARREYEEKVIDYPSAKLTEYTLTRYGVRNIILRLKKKQIVEEKNNIYYVTDKYLREIKFQGFVFGDKATETLFTTHFSEPENLYDFSIRIGALITYTMLQAVKHSKEWSDKQAREWINESISTGHLFKVFKDFIPWNHLVVDNKTDTVRMQFPLDKQSFEKNMTEYKEHFPEFFSELEKIRKELTKHSNMFKGKLENPKSVRHPHENCDNEILTIDDIDLVFTNKTDKQMSKWIWRCHKCGIKITDP